MIMTTRINPVIPVGTSIGTYSASASAKQEKNSSPQSSGDLGITKERSHSRKRCIFRAHGDRGYTKLKNTFLQDARISDETRGLIARLLSYPEDWEVTVKFIVASGKAGRDKVYRMIKEAEKFGYLQPDCQDRDGGKFDRRIYSVSDDPETLIARTAAELCQIERLAQPCPEKPDAINMQHTEAPPEDGKTVADKEFSPCPEKPDAANLSHPAKPYTANPHAYKEDKGKRNIESNIPPYPPRAAGNGVRGDDKCDPFGLNPWRQAERQDVWFDGDDRLQVGNGFRAELLAMTGGEDALRVELDRAAEWIGPKTPPTVLKSKVRGRVQTQIAERQDKDRRYEKAVTRNASSQHGGQSTPSSKKSWWEQQNRALDFLSGKISREEFANG